MEVEGLRNAQIQKLFLRLLLFLTCLYELCRFDYVYTGLVVHTVDTEFLVHPAVEKQTPLLIVRLQLSTS